MANGGGKNRMNTVDKIVSEIAQKLTTSIVDTTYYKVLYDESQENWQKHKHSLNRHKLN